MWNDKEYITEWEVGADYLIQKDNRRLTIKQSYSNNTIPLTTYYVYMIAILKNSHCQKYFFTWHDDFNIIKLVHKKEI